MAIPVVSLIKALTPLVTSLADAAVPAFTSIKSDSAKEDPVLAQQIKELQDASTANAEELKALAEHLQEVVSAADEAATAAERQMTTYKRLLLASMGTAAVSLVVAIAALIL